MPNAYAIIPIGKNDRSAIGMQKKPPELRPLGVSHIYIP